MKNLKKTLTALSLQGGGALGAYEYGVIKALYAKRGPFYIPNVVAGISIGAINAAVLVGAKGDPVAALDELWRQHICVNYPQNEILSWMSSFLGGVSAHYTEMMTQNLSWLGNPGMYNLKPEYMYMPLLSTLQNTSIYDTSALKKTLDKLVDVEKLNHPDQTRFVITAINVKTGKSARFDNATTKITFDHILASASLPVTFPMTCIDGEYYWDGGVFINTPIQVALDALEEVETDSRDVERELIYVELHRMNAQLPVTLQDAAERFYNLIFSGKLSIDQKNFRKYSAFVDLIQKIDEVLPLDSHIREHAGFKDLFRHRKINKVFVIGEQGIGAKGSCSDFSRKTLDLRIEAGFNDTMTVLANNEYFLAD